jgi:hypothetical protein
MADLERDVVEHLAGLDPEARQAAFDRINTGLKLKLPTEEADPPPPVHKFRDYRTMDIEEPPSLVSDGQVVRGEITVNIGRAGKGKTTLLTNRMMRWSAGLPLFDGLAHSQEPVEPLKLLLIENEGSGYYMQESLKKLWEHIDMDDAAKELADENLMVWGDGGYSGLKMDRESDMELVKRALSENPIDMLMLEPFRGIWTGDENDNSAVEQVLDSLVALAHEFNCGIMLSHHANKAIIEDGEFMSAARGATALEGKVATMEYFREVLEGEQRELKWVKQRYGRKQAPIRMSYDFDTRSYEWVPDSEVEKKVLQLMVQDDPPQWWTKSQIADEIGEAVNKIGKALDSLLGQSRVIRKRKEGVEHFKAGSEEDKNGEGLDY